MNSVISVVIATAEEVRNAAKRFPNMPVAKAIELNKMLRTDVAGMMGVKIES